MKLLNRKAVKQSLVKDFYQRHPHFHPRQSALLDHRPAHRWYELLKYGAETDLYNFQEIMQGKSGAEVIIRDQPFHMMSAYDYLGLIGHPEIELAAIEAIQEYGTGTGGVRLLTGTNDLHCRLEKSLTRFKGTEAAMVLSSGYMANMAVLSGLFGKTDIIITDENIHRSITDAIKVSGATQLAFRHNDPASLRILLEKFAGEKRILVIVEGIYSMDGDICPLPEIVKLKQEFNVFLMVDEAHSFGVLGEKGKGLDEYHDIEPSDIDIFTGSLSKAIPANGGFIAAKEEVIVYLKHGGAPYMFSAALSPANTAAAIRSLELIDEENWRLDRLWCNASRMKAGLDAAGIDTGLSQSLVIPVMCGHNERAFTVSKKLFNRGFLANAVVYPAVPVGKSRLRLCCTAAQSPEVIDQFIQALQRIY